MHRNGKIERRTDRRTYGRTDRQTERQSYERTYIHKNEKIGGRTDGRHGNYTYTTVTILINALRQTDGRKGQMPL